MRYLFSHDDGKLQEGLGLGRIAEGLKNMAGSRRRWHSPDKCSIRYKIYIYKHIKTSANIDYGCVYLFSFDRLPIFQEFIFLIIFIHLQIWYETIQRLK